MDDRCDARARSNAYRASFTRLIRTVRAQQPRGSIASDLSTVKKLYRFVLSELARTFSAIRRLLRRSIRLDRAILDGP